MGLSVVLLVAFAALPILLTNKNHDVPRLMQSATVWDDLNIIDDVEKDIDVLEDGIAPVGKNGTSVCYDNLGCFSNDDYYDIAIRPIHVLPDSPTVIKTQFLLYTRISNKQYQIINPDNDKTIQNSDFNGTRPTKFIIHGFLDNQFFGEWMRVMKDEFLTNGDYNVILVDWSKGNGPSYAKATSNTRVVGKQLGMLINYLVKNFGLKKDKVHIVGHSLGAHVAGYAGKEATNISRITGLDPAGPYFQGLPAETRLDKMDAKFVDVIHSDGADVVLFGLGMTQAIGHVDFYPNNGKRQPGCQTEKWTSVVLSGLPEGTRRFVSCNHQRSVDFFIDSINEIQCAMVGVACSDWETFNTGGCSSCGTYGEKCAIMGLRAIESKQLVLDRGSQGKTYLKTASKSPFCVFQYQVRVKLTQQKESSHSGYVSVTLKGSKAEETFQLGDGDEMELAPAASETFLIQTQKDLGDINALDFTWTRRSGSIIPELFKYPINLEQVQVYPISILTNEEPEQKVMSYCDTSKNPIVNKQKVMLLRKDRC